VVRVGRKVETKISPQDETGSSSRPTEEAAPLPSLADMKRRLLFTALAFGLLVLALGGWLVQGLRVTPRLLVAAVH
jgi:hypothetical protein